LIDTAVDLLTEYGPDFSMAEASRRLGVAQSAPYRHFADRNALVAAVAARAATLLAGHLAEVGGGESAGDRLASAAHAYVRFAFEHERLFRALIGTTLDETRYPELTAATRPLQDTFARPAAELAPDHADRLASTIVATAHGHAVLLLDGVFGTGEPARDTAADQAAAATLALIAGRQELGRIPGLRPASRPGTGT
jgi:AcrR family transcriptional regulator